MIGHAALPPDPRARLLRELLGRAGDVALSRFQRHTVRLKEDGTKVTDADLAAHEVLVRGLADAFPGEAIRSEEDVAPVDPHPDAAVWYVDPLDGTGAFTEGLAYWGPTVCRVVGGKLDVGAFWVPRLGELWFAATNAGAWRDDRRLQPPEPSLPDRHAILFVPSSTHRVGPIPWPGRIRALGSTAAHLAHVASGGAAAAVIGPWSLWDVGCGALLLSEAGRVMVTLSGEPFDPMMTPNTPFVAAARSAAPWVVTALGRLARNDGS